MNYEEDFHGIKFTAKRGDVLKITASADEFYIASWDGVLNVMSKCMCGRTAVFVNDCKFFSQTDTGITVEVLPGTGSYMKELNKLRPVKIDEARLHNLGKLW